MKNYKNISQLFEVFSETASNDVTAYIKSLMASDPKVAESIKSQMQSQLHVDAVSSSSTGTISVNDKTFTWKLIPSGTAKQFSVSYYESNDAYDRLAEMIRSIMKAVYSSPGAGVMLGTLYGYCKMYAEIRKIPVSQVWKKIESTYSERFGSFNFENFIASNTNQIEKALADSMSGNIGSYKTISNVEISKIDAASLGTAASKLFNDLDSYGDSIPKARSQQAVAHLYSALTYDTGYIKTLGETIFSQCDGSTIGSVYKQITGHLTGKYEDPIRDITNGYFSCMCPAAYGDAYTMRQKFFKSL